MSHIKLTLNPNVLFFIFTIYNEQYEISWILTFNNGRNIVCHVRWKLSEEIEHRVVPRVANAEVDTAVQQGPHDLHLTAQGGLVHRRPGRSPRIDVHPGSQ